MERHRLGTYAGGVAATKPICELLSVGVDPESTLGYDVIGMDLDNAPVEAGFPSAIWRWAVMPQSDFQYLLDFIAATGSGNVTIRTKQPSGASGFDFVNYTAVMKRPSAGYEGLLRRDVVLEFIQLVAI
jgi:hypothetical protein